MKAAAPSRLILPALLLGLALAVAPARGRDDTSATAPGDNALARELGVPRPDAPWTLTAEVDGGMVILDLPKEQQKIATLPLRVQRAVNYLLQLHPENLARIEQAALVTGNRLRETRHYLRPEHQQNLKRIVLTVSPRPEPRVLGRYEPILRALPEYTAVELFVPAQLLDRVKQELKALSPRNNVRLHPVPISRETNTGLKMTLATTPWARDQAEVVMTDRGTKTILLPLAHNQTYDLARRDNDFIFDFEEPGRSVLTVPLFFKSGNLMMVEAGRRVLFLGEAELQHNEINYRVSAGSRPSRAAVISLYKRLTGADVVEVIPNSPQFFHVDMMMAGIRPQTVALLTPLEGEVLAPEDAAALAALRSALQRHDIRVVPIPTVARRIAQFQSPANAVPFLDLRDQKHSVLVPRFPDVEVRVNGKPQSLNQLVEAAYRNAGLKVLPVEDRFSDLHGNIHCVIMTLS